MIFSFYGGKQCVGGGTPSRPPREEKTIRDLGFPLSSKETSVEIWDSTM